MKLQSQLLYAALFCVASTLTAGTPAAKNPTPPTSLLSDHWSCHRPDGIAPIGVMYDHAHHAGEWMVGYRFNWSHYEGMRQGDNSISNKAVYDLHAPNGSHYTATVLEMEMYMHMLEIMYAPTEWLSFMVMPQYMEMDMTMLHGGDGGGHDDHAAAGGHGHGHAPSGVHEHGTSGYGDTVAAATFTLFNARRQALLATLGLSLPTGAVDEKVGDTYTHYGMQLGSGTWDLLPSLTYLGQTDRFSWGVQYASTLRLEDENDSGFRFGNVHGATTWAALKICDWASVSGRMAYRHEGQIRGHYDGPHNHSAPPDFQPNYGGDTLDLGVGVNLYAPNGALKGNRLAVEVLFPVYQDLNGVQVERDFTLAVGWQWAF